ncbi:MAG: Rieske 2Fe-2S domain-containing protein [Octadecabacter sp.]|nr:Rieske 2Fe-2S domain-containing protein [Octadecabacter sp.]
MTFLGENFCVFRSEARELVGREVACPHRKILMFIRRIKGDTYRCDNHGLTFDCAGQYVWAPGTGRILSNACVHAYPLNKKIRLV